MSVLGHCVVLWDGGAASGSTGGPSTATIRQR
jgi:hypothetical protein